MLTRSIAALLCLLFILFSVAAAEPLPPRLERRLQLARMLPPVLAAPMMMRYLRDASLDRVQRAEFAQEAYLLATSFGMQPMRSYAVFNGSAPIDWLSFPAPRVMNPQAAALRAWVMYEGNYDRAKQKPLEFPTRKASVEEGCGSALVDDPMDYYEAAAEAGPRVLAMATPLTPNSIELGRLLAAYTGISAAERPLSRIIKWLNRADNNRQFAYAMEFTPLHNSMLRIALEAGRLESWDLFEAYARFLGMHWAQGRCRGNERIGYAGVIAEFNEAAAKAEERNWGRPPLRFPRLREYMGRSRFVVRSYAEPQEDLRELKLLRTRLDGSVSDDLNTAAILRAVEDFHAPIRLGPAADLLQKNFAHREVFVYYRNGPYEWRAMEAWLRYFAFTNAQREAPHVWLAVVRDVREWVGKNENRRKMAEAAGDPALAALLNLEVLDQK